MAAVAEQDGVAEAGAAASGPGGGVVACIRAPRWLVVRRQPAAWQCPAVPVCFARRSWALRVRSLWLVSMTLPVRLRVCRVGRLASARPPLDQFHGQVRAAPAAGRERPGPAVERRRADGHHEVDAGLVVGAAEPRGEVTSEPGGQRVVGLLPALRGPAPAHPAVWSGSCGSTPCARSAAAAAVSAGTCSSRARGRARPRSERRTQARCTALLGPSLEHLFDTTGRGASDCACPQAWRRSGHAAHVAPFAEHDAGARHRLGASRGVGTGRAADGRWPRSTRSHRRTAIRRWRPASGTPCAVRRPPPSASSADRRGSPSCRHLRSRRGRRTRWWPSRRPT